MNPKVAVSFLLFILFQGFINAQRIELLNTGNIATSLRGISVYGNTIWVSGSNGKIGRSEDAGNTWQWITVKGFEQTDFRDIEALNEYTAIIMGIASPAYILKTTDSGKTFNTVYTNHHPQMFLDAMAFKNKKKGVVIGDPVNDTFFVASTNDGGNTWHKTSRLKLPVAQNKEAFFAASGSNIVLQKNNFYIVSGGKESRLFTKNKTLSLPIIKGNETSGANAVAVYKNKIAIAGGNFINPNNTDSAFIISNNSGGSWQGPIHPPSGYRSSVCFVSKNIMVACGINGVDISYDSGQNWKKISDEGFNACVADTKKKIVFFCGNNAKVGKLTF